MNYLDCYNFIHDRLASIDLLPQKKPGRPSKRKDPEEEAIPDIQPLQCTRFEELCDHYFTGEGCLEYRSEIAQTLATMSTVILSTSTSGGQLGLRVLGPPGSAKSTLSECLSFAKQLVYAKSKFTGIVSGWSSLRKSHNLAAKINGKCLLVKDADTMMQLPNLKQIQSELRDALGDAVIRAEYRTGREFDIRTLFTVILCGTQALRNMDDPILGARFLDISIHQRGSDTTKIVDRAIKSQFSEIWGQLTGEEEDNTKIKRIIRKLAPPTVGFLLHKREQIDSKVLRSKGFGEYERQRLRAIGQFVAMMRTRPTRTNTGEIDIKAESEIPTRLGEHFTRLAVFLGICLQDREIEIGDNEFAIINKIAKDTAEGPAMDIVTNLFEDSLTTQDLSLKTDYSMTRCRELISDLKEAGIVEQATKISNPHGARGQSRIVYKLKDDFRSTLKRAEIF